MARLPPNQYQELLKTLERVKQEAIEPTPSVPLKRLRQVRFTEIFPKPRKFNLLAPSFFARVEEKLKESGCSVVVSRKTKTEGRLVIFNDGSKAPIGDNRPVIIDVDENKMVLSRQGEEGRVEFVKGPDVSGRWGAGRDWIVSNAQRLLIGEIGGQVVPKVEVNDAVGEASTEQPQVQPAEAMELQQPPQAQPDYPSQVQQPAKPVVKEEAMEDVNVENIPPITDMTPATGGIAPASQPNARQPLSGTGEPMIPIREVLRELATWGQTLSSRANMGGTPNPPVMRPPTPPIANLSPWLLRQRRTILEMIAGENQLAFWENSIGEFCYGRDAASVPSTSSAQPPTIPHLIVSDVYLPGFITVATGDYRLPVGSMIAKGDWNELPIWSQLRGMVKGYFQQ